MPTKRKHMRTERRNFLILLLEDEIFIAMDIEESLLSANFETIKSVATRAAANEWLEANTPHVAIVDPHLQDGVCGDVVRTLIERGVPFIVYSGDRVRDDDDDRSFDLGHWLAKPSAPETLTNAVERLVAQN